jgi:Glycosyl hydrolase family 76
VNATFVRYAGCLVVVATAAALLAVPPSRGDTGSSTRARLVGEVEQGLAAVNKRWTWQGWYQDVRGVPGWSSIWDTEHLFQAYVGLQIAAPSTRHRNMLLWFAAKSEGGYYNPRLGDGLGGFSTGYGRHGEQGQQWFDDNGWLGLSFVDAYRLTHRHQFLADAEIAFRYMYRNGWDPDGGGIWWSTQHTVKSAESVNTAALLAVELYELHAGAGYLTAARRLIGWADDNLLDAASGLYDNHPEAGVTISYLESPMLSAFMRLCRDEKLYCDRVAPLTRAILAQYGGDLHQPPQFDATYLRYLLDAYQLSHDSRLYAVAYRNALRVEQYAADGDGYYLKAWDGSMHGVRPGLISVDGAALEVLAWTAATAPPD